MHFRVFNDEYCIYIPIIEKPPSTDIRIGSYTHIHSTPKIEHTRGGRETSGRDWSGKKSEMGGGKGTPQGLGFIRVLARRRAYYHSVLATTRPTVIIIESTSLEISSWVTTVSRRSSGRSVVELGANIYHSGNQPHQQCLPS